MFLALCSHHTRSYEWALAFFFPASYTSSGAVVVISRRRLMKYRSLIWTEDNLKVKGRRGQGKNRNSEEKTHRDLAFKYPLSARGEQGFHYGHNSCQNGTDPKHVIWLFVSRLRVAKGQIASYGAFLYQNNCLGESLQHRTFAVE